MAAISTATTYTDEIEPRLRAAEDLLDGAESGRLPEHDAITAAITLVRTALEFVTGVRP